MIVILQEPNPLAKVLFLLNPISTPKSTFPI